MTTFNNALYPAPPSNGLPLALSSSNQHFAAWSPLPGQVQAPVQARGSAAGRASDDDPTMEEILGSIQRILDEQEPQQAEPVQLYPHPRPAPPPPAALAAPVSHGALVPVSRAVAPVQQTRSNDDPSMEEILASIRRISGEQ